MCSTEKKKRVHKCLFVLMFLGGWVTIFLAVTPAAGSDCPRTDLNKDCAVDFKDIAVLGIDWLKVGQIIFPDPDVCCQVCTAPVIDPCNPPTYDVNDPVLYNAAIDYYICMFRLIVDYHYASLDAEAQALVADYNDLAVDALTETTALLKYYAPSFSPQAKEILVYTVTGWPKIKLPKITPSPIPNPLDLLGDVIKGIKHEGEKLVDMMKDTAEYVGESTQKAADAVKKASDKYVDSGKRGLQRAVDVGLSTTEGQAAKAAIETSLDVYDESREVVESAK